MVEWDIQQLAPAIPEIILALAACVLLMVGAFRQAVSARFMCLLSAVVLAMILVLVLSIPAGPRLGFGGMFIFDGFAKFAKALVLIGSILAIIMSLGYIERENMARFEYPLLFLFATLGMMMMISANDLIALYLGIELQSLSLYIIASFRIDSTRSTEAGLKYFVLGALSSGMLLYGSSLVYGFAGTTDFTVLAKVLTGHEPAIGVVIGLVFIAAGLAFKVSAVPFHMWTPDVYEGAPTPVTAFFAVAPKIAAVALLVRVMMGPFGGMIGQWQQIIIVLSAASMVLGAFAAINQRNIKRLMAYSSIGHVGYVLIGLAAGTEAGVRGVLIYLMIYLFMTAGTFACILTMRFQGRMLVDIDDLAGLGRTRPALAVALGVFMFSLAGIPPLGGFFGKLFVFMAAIDAKLYTLAIIGVLSSVVSAFYYLRIVKIMYFDDAAEPFDRPMGHHISLIVTGTALFIAFFVIIQAPLLAGAAAAAKSLFTG